MSTIGSPIESSLVQAAQAQQVASKKRDRDRGGEAESARRLRDLVDIRVAGVEQAGAVRKLPGNESEQADQEHRGDDTPDARTKHIDVRA